MSNQKRQTIQNIKDRYYREVIAGSMVTHHGDCHIHRAEYPHCSCGLIHDLLPLHFPDRIFSQFSEDRAKSDGVGTIHKKPTKEQAIKNQEFLDDLMKNGVFKKMTDLPPEAGQLILQSISEEEEAITELLGL